MSGGSQPKTCPLPWMRQGASLPPPCNQASRSCDVDSSCNPDAVASGYFNDRISKRRQNHTGTFVRQSVVIGAAPGRVDECCDLDTVWTDINSASVTMLLQMPRAGPCTRI